MLLEPDDKGESDEQITEHVKKVQGMSYLERIEALQRGEL
jgi:hypothetical protein